MRSLLKGLGLAPLLFFYALIAGIICLIPADHTTKRMAAIRTTSGFARIVLNLFGVRIRVKHRERLRKTSEARLIVSNHLSYIDVLILSSLLPSVFITSVELKNTVLLGTLARLNASLFVERRKRSGLKHEIENIVLVLGQGISVALFPEGTTSNGDQVQPFKNSLFDAAVLTHTEILPICLCYNRVNNERITPKNRDLVFYYGGATFVAHFRRFLSLRSVDVEVVPLNGIKVPPRRSRKELAAEAHETITREYQDLCGRT
jgi:1-acyl-sn-glycerol-3-phosphate acyltransferase